MRDHPLFPPKDDDDDDAPEVVTIFVTRHEAGRWIYAPSSFAAADLPDLETLHALFGGGRYELIARDERRITARRVYELDGRSRPLAAASPGDDEPERQRQPAPAAAPAGGDQQLVLALLQMMSQQQSTMMTFVTAMMQSSQNAGREHLAQMQSAQQAALEGQGRVFEALMQAGRAGGGAGGLDPHSVLDFIQMGAEMVRGQAEAAEDDGPGDIEAVTSGVRAATEMLATLRGAAPPRQRPPGAPPGMQPATPPQSEEAAE